LPIQYTDFAHWQRESLRSETLEQQFAYWRSRLADVPILQLPTDRPRPPMPTFSGASEAIALPQRLMEALKILGKQEDATPLHHASLRLSKSSSRGMPIKMISP